MQYISVKCSTAIHTEHDNSVLRTSLGLKSNLTQCWKPLPLIFIDVITSALPRKCPE